MRNRVQNRIKPAEDNPALTENMPELDRLIESKLAKIEQLLEARNDASLELAQLRELRQLCAGIKALVRKSTGIPE